VRMGFAYVNQKLKQRTEEFTRFIGQYGYFPGKLLPEAFDTSGVGPYHARAMGNPLRERRTAADWASSSQVIEIAEKISSFEGLAEIVEADLAALDAEKRPMDWRASTVLGELRFGFADGDHSIATMTGHASVAVDAVCQRCLEAFQLTLEIEPRLLLLGQQEEGEGYDDFEVWELQEYAFRPLDAVQEMLIMALPFAATHDNMAECKAFSTEDEVAEEMTTPFADLRSQMKQNQ